MVVVNESFTSIMITTFQYTREYGKGLIRRKFGTTVLLYTNTYIKYCYKTKKQTLRRRRIQLIHSHKQTYVDPKFVFYCLHKSCFSDYILVLVVEIRSNTKNHQKLFSSQVMLSNYSKKVGNPI